MKVNSTKDRHGRHYPPPLRLILTAGICAVTLLGSLAAHAVIYPYYDLPKLAATSDAIVAGTVVDGAYAAVAEDRVDDGVDAGQAAVLRVDRVVKGNVESRITVVGLKIGVSPPAQFEQGKQIVVFLRPPDAAGVHKLMGYGNQGKWMHKESVSGWSLAYTRASREEFLNAVLACLKIQAIKEDLPRAREIAALFSATDPAIKQAGFDLALAERNHDVRQLLAAKALPFISEPDPSMRPLVVRILNWAPGPVILDAMIPVMDDSDKYYASQVKVALRMGIGDCRLTSPLLDLWLNRLTKYPDAAADPETAAVKSHLEELWKEKRAECVNRSAATLRTDRSGDNALKREAAPIFLDYLGVKE